MYCNLVLHNFFIFFLLLNFITRFGAGSEFGREAKEEARRKKLGIITRKYKADDQPWILKSYGSGVKKFKGKF